MARHAAAAALMLAMSSAAVAAKPPELTGPITVTANEVDWNDNQQMEYRGNVKLVADGFTMAGALLRLEQRSGGVWVELIGTPAELEQVDARIEGTVRARAERLTYDAATQWIDLNGNARLNRGNDRVEGRSIRYNVTERQVQARRAADDDQVRIIIHNARVRGRSRAEDDSPATETPESTPPAPTPADPAPAP